MAKILITGGAGYIGAVTVRYLLDQACEVISIDKAALNYATFTQAIATGQLVVMQSDYARPGLLEHIFSTYSISAVVHCAASIEVGQSVIDPALYYDNNVTKTLALLNAMHRYGVKRIIFSSSAAVYGAPTTDLLDTSCATTPISPYGNTKLTVERILHDYAHAYNLTCIALRYFNVAGAWVEHMLGEQHIPESHLIPLLLGCLYNRIPFKVFGHAHKTPDGTCIRDYVHVLDIARAHYAAYTSQESSPFIAYTVGTGIGHSVQEIIQHLEHITGRALITTYAPARAGDPAYLRADTRHTQTCLKWQPEYSSLDHILTSAHAFYLRAKQLD